MPTQNKNEKEIVSWVWKKNEFFTCNRISKRKRDKVSGKAN